jgi:hypothetical protein
MVGRAGIGAESFAARAATISPPLPPLGFVESVADNVSRTGFPRQWTFPVWAADTSLFLNRFNDGIDCMELSLKLYHVWELRLRCQQLMAEAPADFSNSYQLICVRCLICGLHFITLRGVPNSKSKYE